MTEGFLTEQKKIYKNVALIVTHLSELLKHVAKNKIENFDSVMCLKENFTLKQIPNIQKIVGDAGKSQKTTTKGDISFLKIEDLLGYLKISNALRSEFDHRVIFLALTGLRFQSSLDIKINSTYVQKACKICSNTKICSQPTSKCFDRIKIHTTKTTEHEFPIIPQAYKSFVYLRDSKSNSSKYYAEISRKFNNHLKNRHNLTSHSLRKFLPNFVSDFSSSCNTGNWKGPSGLANMKKFYLQREFKYVSIFMMLRDSGLIC